MLVGYESGVFSTVFRIMMPIFHKGEFIGSVGIGINPNYFLEKINEITGEKGALFISNVHLNLYSMPIKYSIGKYRLQTKLNQKELSLLSSLPKDYNFEDNIPFTFSGRDYIAHSLNIDGYGKSVYAKYIFFQDVTDAIASQQQTRLYIILTIFIFMGLIFITIQFFLNKFSDDIDIFYNSTIETMKFDKGYLEAVEDNSSNLIITSLRKQLYSANKSFFEFSGFSTVEEFKKKYSCVCDLFIKRKGYLQKYINHIYWVDYINSHPDIVHKAIMIKDNKEYIFQVTTSPLNIDKEERCVSTFVDITHNELIKDRYEIAITGTQDGLWDWNLITGDMYFSPQWKKQVGYEDDELVNELQTWETLVHPDDKEQAVQDFTANIERKTKTYENIHRLKHKDGSWVWILDRGQTSFNEDGQPIRMVGFHTDRTKEKNLEIDLKNQEEVMIAQSRHAAMGEMISMIAHQWRQPLSIIAMGANNMMADIELDMIDEKVLKEGAEEIILQTQELSQTIDDFKNFFKPIKITETILPQDILKDAFNIIGKSLESHNINIITHYDSEQKITTYSRELMHVFINLIKNAKEILIDKEIQDKKIIITISDIPNMISIKICDNAGGIPDDIINKIFNPYFSTKDEHNGTGLGLYMSKTIIEKHLNGIITAYNNNEGACFEIQLPF